MTNVYCFILIKFEYIIVIIFINSGHKNMMFGLKWSITNTL